MQQGVQQGLPRKLYLLLYVIALVIGILSNVIVILQQNGSYGLFYMVAEADQGPSFDSPFSAILNVTTTITDGEDSSFNTTMTTMTTILSTPLNLDLSQSTTAESKKEVKVRRGRKHRKERRPYLQPPQPNLKSPYVNATRLLQTGYFHRLGESIARAYTTDGNPMICSRTRPVRLPVRGGPQVYEFPIEGIFYNKVAKAASSTLVAINRRIAVHWGHRLYGNSPSVSSHHSSFVVLSPGDSYGTEVSCTH